MYYYMYHTIYKFRKLVVYTHVGNMKQHVFICMQSRVLSIGGGGGGGGSTSQQQSTSCLLCCSKELKLCL